MHYVDIQNIINISCIGGSEVALIYMYTYSNYEKSINNISKYQNKSNSLSLNLNTCLVGIWIIQN